MKNAFVDEHGFLRGLPYHDGLLRAVVWSASAVSIEMESTAGEHNILSLHDVTAFSAEGVREGNIILDVRLLETYRIVGDPVLNRVMRERLHIEPAMSEAQAKFLFYLECSFGAEVLALCSRWSSVPGRFVLNPSPTK